MLFCSVPVDSSPGSNPWLHFGLVVKHHIMVEACGRAKTNGLLARKYARLRKRSEFHDPLQRHVPTRRHLKAASAPNSTILRTNLLAPALRSDSQLQHYCRYTTYTLKRLSRHLATSPATEIQLKV